MKEHANSASSWLTVVLAATLVAMAAATVGREADSVSRHGEASRVSTWWVDTNGKQAGEATSQAEAGETSSDGTRRVTVNVRDLKASTPLNVTQLRAIQKRVRQVVKKAMPATVGLRLQGGMGSGVIVSKDGLILTAGHVSGTPKQSVSVIFANGQSTRGRSLGNFEKLDCGMVQIVGQAPRDGWPHVELADSSKVGLGDWCVALGHPDGYQRGRTPVVRLGRVIINREDQMWSDCPLVGGDSGGPLLDLDGRLIGINSRIGLALTRNVHAPVNAFRENWERLTKGEQWGGQVKGVPRAFLGVMGQDHEKGCQIVTIVPNSPAAKGLLQVGDIVTAIDGKPVKGLSDLYSLTMNRKPGELLKIEFLRGDKRYFTRVRLRER